MRAETVVHCVFCARKCEVTVVMEDGRLISAEGNICRKGMGYAVIKAREEAQSPHTENIVRK